MLNVHLDRAAQIELFKGCVMIDWRHFKLPHGHIADVPRFNAWFGGYVFLLDGMNERMTTSPVVAFRWLAPQIGWVKSHLA